jgi:hypothetical protein
LLCALYYREFVLKEIAAPGEEGLRPSASKHSSYGTPLKQEVAHAPPIVTSIASPTLSASTSPKGVSE